MVEAIAAIQPETKSVPRPPWRTIRWWGWGSALLIAGLTVYIVAIALNWPFTQQAVVDALQERSLRAVTIGHFHRTYLPPGCTAEDIRFLHRKHKEKEPLIKVRRLVLVTNYFRIFTLQERLTLVRVMDMHVTVPPGVPGQPNPVMPLTYSQSAPSIKMDRIIADGTTLDFLSKTGQKPYRLIVDKLRLDDVGNNEPMSYEALISNELPPGKIHSTGTFGTWDPNDPGRVPVQGSYSFENANLAAFGGISGTLFSSGNFKGILREISVRGTAEVPNFKVSDARRDYRLTTAYRALVNGTNGDTKLEEVTARFGHTTAEFSGSIGKNGDTDSKAASLDMWTNDARVDDVLGLFISAQRAPMTGAFLFSAHAYIPGGPEPFLRRLKLIADFGVRRGKFANAETERDLTRLSDSSRKYEENPPDRPMLNVVSELKGHASSENGVAKLSNLSFSIPGAKAWMQGTYGLVDTKADLHGTLLTKGSPSDAAQGFRSLVVKVITPFFRKRHAEKLIPFKITGSHSKLDVSLDLVRRHQPHKS